MTTSRRDILAWRERDASRPPLLKYRSSNVFILSTICIAVFTDMFLYGIIVPVIPFALTTRAGVAEEDIQHWVSVLLAVYGAALIAASPICGWCADRTNSRRLPLLLGLLALGGATLMLCLGRSIAVLVIGRLLQGLSAAVVWTVGLALLVDTVGPTDIAQMLGYVALSLTVATFLAPLLGGVVYNKVGYYAVYYMAFGMIMLDIILRVFLVEKKVAKQWTVTAQPAGVNVPVWGPAVPEPEIQPVSDTEASRQKRRQPMLTLLSSRRLWSALWCALVQAVLMTAWDATLPLRVSHLFSWTSLGAGLIFLPCALPSFFAPLIGKYIDVHGPRLPAVFGFLLSAPPLILLRLVDHGGIRQIVLLCALLAILGFTLTMAVLPCFAEITYVVAHKEKAHPGGFGRRGAYAQAYGIYNCAFAGGMLVGPLWGGFVVGRAGWGTMCWSLGLLSAASAVPAVLWTGGWITERKAKKDGDAGEPGVITEEGRIAEENRGAGEGAKGSSPLREVIDVDESRKAGER